MAKTTGIEEASADLPRISNYVMRTDVPATMSMNDMPLVDVASASRDAVDVAAGFMDEYASLFAKLAK